MYVRVCACVCVCVRFWLAYTSHWCRFVLFALLFPFRSLPHLCLSASVARVIALNTRKDSDISSRGTTVCAVGASEKPLCRRRLAFAVGSCGCVCSVQSVVSRGVCSVAVLRLFVWMPRTCAQRCGLPLLSSDLRIFALSSQLFCSLCFVILFVTWS